MHKGRLEAFSDGVIAIIITIMVLELRPPEGGRIADLRPLVPVFASYALSFVYLGIYWANHHHMFQAVRSVAGGILWANLHLLFWLSTVPFVTAWMGAHPTDAQPAAAYGVVLLCCAMAYTILMTVLVAHEGRESDIAKAMGRDVKGKLSLVLYAAGIVAALTVGPWLGQAFYVVVALIWLVPDRRIERQLGAH